MAIPDLDDIAQRMVDAARATGVPDPQHRAARLHPPYNDNTGAAVGWMKARRTLSEIWHSAHARRIHAGPP